MACYGGNCEPTCPMYGIHHPRMITCASCGEASLSWYVLDGRCPACGKPVGGRDSERREDREGG